MRGGCQNIVLRPAINKLRLDDFKPSIKISAAPSQLRPFTSSIKSSQCIQKKCSSPSEERSVNKKRTITFSEAKKMNQGSCFIRPKSQTKNLMRIRSKENSQQTQKANLHVLQRQSGHKEDRLFEKGKQQDSLKIESFFSEILAKMVDKKCCEVCGETVKIKKEKMKPFFLTLLGVLYEAQKEVNHSSSKENSLISKIKKLTKGIMFDLENKNLQLVQQSVSLDILPQKYFENISQINNQLSEESFDIKNLLFNIKFDQNNQCVDQVQQKVKELEGKIHKLREEEKTLQFKSKNLIDKINKSTELLSQLDQKVQQINIFIDNEDENVNNIEIRSPDEKLSETQFFYYAKKILLKIQASSQAWNSHLQHILEEQNPQQIEEVQQKGMENASEGQDQNLAKMKQFLQRSSQKLKENNKEMTKMVTEDSKLIQGFMQKLRIYLNNFQVKKEFSRKLKKLFVIKSFKFSQNLRKIISLDLNETQRNLLKKLLQYWKDIEENHKIGNLLY